MENEFVIEIKKGDHGSILDLYKSLYEPINDFLKSKINTKEVSTNKIIRGKRIKKEILNDDYRIVISIEKK